MKAAKTTEAFHIRFRNFFVGVFLLVPVVLIPVLLVFTLGKSQLTEQWTHLYAVYSMRTGLEKGSAVTIRGIKIGHVEGVGLERDGDVLVKFKVNEEYAPLIKKDSKAWLKQKNIAMGDWVIELTIGSDTSEMVLNGDTLQPEVPVNIEATVAQVTGMVEKLQELVEAVLEGKGTVGRLLLDDELYESLNSVTRGVASVTRNARMTMGNVDALLDTLTAAGSGSALLLDSALTTVKDFNALMANVDSLVSGFKPLPSDMRALLSTMHTDMRETEVILKALQDHWLLRRRVKKVVDTIPEADK